MKRPPPRVVSKFLRSPLEALPLSGPSGKRGFAWVAMVASLASASWIPESYNRIDWSNPVGMVDPEAIPLVPNCLDPIQVEVIQSGVRGGVATHGIGFEDGCALPPFRGQKYEVVVTVPYVVTCGNGVRYLGESRWNPTTYLEQGCGETDRKDTWTNHSYPQGEVQVDAENRIRNMYWRGKEIGFGQGSVGPIRFSVEGLKKDALRGASVTLPPYTGGALRLSRPLVFVHGLDVPYDETWGVRAPMCTPDESSIVTEPGKAPRGAVRFRKTGLGGLEVEFQVSQAFLGTCKENTLPSVWESGWKPLFQFQVAALSTGRTEADLWAALVNDQPPVLEDLRIAGENFEGSAKLWVPADHLAHPNLDSRYEFEPQPLEIRLIGGATVALARIRFHVSMAGIEWDHASLAKQMQGRWGQVDPVAGKVDPYSTGSAPDLISRLQRLKKGDQINQNGIYFFNGYRWSADSGKLIQPLPWWNDAGETFPGQRGESWELYQFLSDVLTAHYGTSWTTDPDKTLDLAVHSQGGISTREMLRNAASTDLLGNPLPTGVANPANHIRRVVTVNTPHFGSVTTTEYASLPPEFMSSHGRILRDSARTDITLVDATVDPTLLARSIGGGLGAAGGAVVAGQYMYSIGDGTGDWRESAGDVLATVTAPLWAPLAMMAGATVGSTMETRFQIQGHWLKLNSMLVTGVWPGGAEKKLGRFDLEADIAYSRLFDGRKKGAHLGLTSAPIQLLATEYPKLPDGRDLDLQTLNSTIGGSVDVLRAVLSRTIGDACASVDQEGVTTCYGFADAFKYGEVADAIVDQVDVEMPILPFLDEYQKGYMALTDGAVGEQSQRAVRKGTTWDPLVHPDRFHDPRAYDLRRFLTRGRFPDSLVPHGDLGTTFNRDLLGRLANPSRIVGAPQQGFDIYCALASDCRDLWELGGAPARLPESGARIPLRNGPAARSPVSWVDTVSVVGDFRLGVMPQGEDFHGFVITNRSGSLRGEIRSSPEVGLEVKANWNPTWIAPWRVVPPGYSVRPVLVREQGQLRVEATTWRDQKIVASLPSFWLPETLVLGVIAASEQSPKPILIGRGAVDPILRDPRGGVQARVWFRERRGADTRYSRPLMAVENIGRDTLRGVDLRYVFRADPAHPPVLEAPAGAPWSVRPLGSDLWELAYQNPGLLVPPGGMAPVRAEAEVALHMDNDAPWDVFKDPSNNGNIGAALPNDQILLHDGSGERIWGDPLSLEDLERRARRQVTVITREAATGERNVSKPEIEIRNDGNVPLRNLQAVWITRVPERRTAILERWNAGEASTRLDSLGNGYWAVTWTFPRWIQPREKTMGGNVGIRLSDWSSWDRSLAPSRQRADGGWGENPWVQVRDESGRILWGNLPSLDRLRETVPVVDSGSGPSDPVSVPSLRVEMRDEAPWESNMMKPRVRVINTGALPVSAFTLIFPYQTERGVEAKGELWHPGGCLLSTRTEVNGLGEGRLRCEGLSIAPGSVWPDPSGAVMGFHHVDWSAWDRTNDPAFRSVGSEYAVTTVVGVEP